MKRNRVTPNTRKHDPLASFVPSRVFRIGLPRHCASTRFRSSIDIRLWRQSVRADSLTSPSGPGRSPYSGARFRFRRYTHNRGVACAQLTACVCHCWHSLLGHRLRIAPRYGIRPRLASSSSRLPAIACFDPVISTWALCAASLPALLLTRFRPGAMDSASGSAGGFAPAGNSVGLPKRSHKASPESRPCPDFFTLRARKFTGFVAPVE